MNTKGLFILKTKLPLLLAALFSMTFSAQNLEHVIDMDRFVDNDGFLLSQNNPNPFSATTDIYLAVIEPAEVTLAIADVYGHLEATYKGSFEPGVHQFRIWLKAKGNHVIGAHQNKHHSSALMICNEGGSTNRLDYVGLVEPIDASVIETLLDNDKDEDFVGYASLKSAQDPYCSNGPFRVALSLSPFSMNQFDDGYQFIVNNDTAKTAEELQNIYRQLGSTEMYVRLATKRHKTYNPDGSLDNTTDGKKDENANNHTFDQVLQTCSLAAKMNIPINPEVMCAYTYMDMDNTQAPRFEEYPSIYALQHGKKWEELSLDEICTVLEAYGEFVADSILATGCTVNNWNIGNEANFGFAGIGIGTPNSFDQTLAKASAMKRYTSAIFSLWWLKKHVWKYEAQTLAAVKRGILTSYQKAGKSTADLKFSTHIATVVSTPRSSASFFRYMAKHGYAMETAGISYYPSAPAMAVNKKKLLTKTVIRIQKKCDIPVFIGEFSYPSEDMVGPFAGWNKKLKGYEKDQQGQADIYADVIKWGKTHGLAGIRYWAPDYEGEWYPMSMFEFENKVGKAKLILTNHKEIVQ